MSQDPDDYGLRREVVTHDLSPEEEILHERALAFLRDGLKKGEKLPQLARSLPAMDAGLKAMILDDFLKVTLAERHFSGGERMKALAKEIGLPMERLVEIRANMLKEVEEAAIKAYHLSKEREKNLQ